VTDSCLSFATNVRRRCSYVVDDVFVSAVSRHFLGITTSMQRRPGERVGRDAHFFRETWDLKFSVQRGLTL